MGSAAVTGILSMDSRYGLSRLLAHHLQQAGGVDTLLRFMDWA